jgi:hypothetical protein
MAESEFKNFDKTLRKILSVTSKELKEREENWKKEQREKRKTKPSASAPVSCVKD